MKQILPRNSASGHTGATHLLVAIDQGGSNISAESALNQVSGYGVGVGVALTRRDLQASAKLLRRPWDRSKGFDPYAPMSELVSVAMAGHPALGRIYLGVDGDTKQDDDLADQIWSVAHVVAFL